VQDADREPERPTQGRAGEPGRDEKSRHRSILWRRLLISVLIIAAGLSIPTLLLIENFRQSPRGLVLPASIGHNLSGSPVVIYPAQDSPEVFCFSFLFLGLSPGETSSAQLQITIRTTEQGQAMLEHEYSPQAIGTLTIQSVGGASSSIPVPLSALKRPTRSVPVTSCAQEHPVSQDFPEGITVTTSAPVTGVPRAFPNDWYDLNTQFYLSLPPVPGKKSVPFDWSRHTTVTMASTDVDYSVSAFGGQAGIGGSLLPILGILATIVRPRLFQSYIYLVASAPFILLVSIFAVYYSRNPRRRKPEPYELAFGITAALVAILPLRSVLIPSSLPSPTRLDILFGIGTIFLVVSSIIWLIFSTATPDQDGSQPKNRGSVPSATEEQPGHIEGTAPHDLPGDDPR
jgi:hypothetical protein